MWLAILRALKEKQKKVISHKDFCSISAKNVNGMYYSEAENNCSPTIASMFNSVGMNKESACCVSKPKKLDTLCRDFSKLLELVQVSVKIGNERMDEAIF